jgi:arsenate reductase
VLLMRPDLWRRCLAELVGTAFLVAVVVGSGIAAQRMSPHDVGLQLLENAAATAAGLVALILALGPVSGAHFNPVVTLADRYFGGVSNRDVLAYVPSQIVGACAGALLANGMFAERVFQLSTKTRSSGALWVAEVVATVGLLLVIFGVVRSGRATAAPFAVGAYIGGAYFFTSSTSFANPAVTIGRTLSDTFAGIRPSSAPAFVAAQVVGLVVAVVLIRALYPDAREVASESDVPEVLFVCVHNAGRSQAAAALLNHYAAGRVHVRSAGSAPTDEINPSVRAVLEERGLDITHEFPKLLTDEVARAADVIVTMGCGDACPVFLGKRYLDWQLEDPAGKPVDEVRQIIDDIDRRVRDLLAELVPSHQ